MKLMNLMDIYTPFAIYALYYNIIKIIFIFTQLGDKEFDDELVTYSELTYPAIRISLIKNANSEKCTLLSYYLGSFTQDIDIAIYLAAGWYYTNCMEIFSW